MIEEINSCCPICGKDFLFYQEELYDEQRCCCCERIIKREDMIGPDDDYAWVE